jgi:WD40 repeat protein
MNDIAPVPRRFLISTAISRYPKAPQWDRPALAAARQEIIDLFTGRLGYQHVSDLGLDPTRDQLTERLRTFCRSPDRHPDDLIAVYIAAHGEVLDESREHLLLTSETDPNDIADALPTAELARKMLLETRARRVLLMLDTCYSGRGSNELAASALVRMTESWSGTGAALAIISSAQPDEQALTGAFPQLLQAAVDSVVTAGYVPAALALDAVVNAMNANSGRPGFQKVGLIQIGLTGEVPPFLPNPRHIHMVNDVDLSIQQAIEWESQAERREVEYSSRLLIRAMGSPDSTGGWWFTGRRAALTDITSWLSNPDPARPVLAVTAAPGSGKTAVLGLIATLTHPVRRVTVSRDALGLPEAAIPNPDAVDVTIYAQNLSADQVLQGIAAAARITADTAGELLAALTGREKPFTILIDALDEAADPEQLVSHLLNPLASHAAGRLRLLVGTRPHLLSQLGVRRSDSIDLDDQRYADPEALATYAARGLLGANADTPYLRATPEHVRQVAWAVAEAANASFLVARITSGTLAAAESVVPDPQDPSWRAGLPRAAGQAMRLDLATRLDGDAHRAQDLLRPLAFAEGQGLPWEDLWASLASAMAGRRYTDEDLLWLRRVAGSYVVEASEAGRSVYRLYHQALAEYLQENIDRFSVEASFVDVLLSHVPRNDDGTKNWDYAHPYTRHYLVSHAAACDRLDPLLLDPGFQLAAAQPELLAHLSNAQSDEAIAAAAAYQQAAHHLRDKSGEDRASYLELVARRVHADSFADSISHLMPNRSWSAQWINWQTETQHKILARHAEAVVDVTCISIADGRKCAVSLGLDRSLQTIDLLNRQSIAMPWTASNGTIIRVDAISSTDSEQFIITSSLRDGVVLWSLSDHEIEAKRLPDDSFNGGMINLVELANQRMVAVFGSYEGTIRVRDMITGKAVGRAINNLKRERSIFWTMTSASLSGERAIIITANEDAPVRMWDAKTGEIAGPSITGHPGRVMELSCIQMPDGRTVVLTSGDDSKVRVWDLVTGEPACVPLAGHDGGVGALDCAILPDGRTIAITGAHDGTIRTWDLSTGEMIGDPMSGHPGSVRTISHTRLHDGRTVIVTGGNEGTVRMWDLPTDTNRTGAWEPPSRIVSMVRAQIPDRRDVIVGGRRDGTLHVWDLTTGRTINEPIIAHSDMIWAVSYGQTSTGQDIAISASQDETTRLWDLENGQVVRELAQPPTVTFALACIRLADGRTAVITGGSDPVMRIWDLDTGDKISHIRTHRKGSGKGLRSSLEITAIACTPLPDGRRVIVTGHGTGTIRMWDLSTGQRVGGPMISRDPGQLSNAEISAIACTRLPDNRVVAITGSEDTTRSTVRAWDLSTGHLLARSSANTSWIKAVCCALLPSGRTVVITGDDVMRIWDLDIISDSGTKNDWVPLKEIDLDAPIGGLIAGPNFSIIAGTFRGIVGLTLLQVNLA